MNPRVFVTQWAQRKVYDSEIKAHVWSKLDISPAMKYGELVELVPPGPVIRSTGQLVATLRSKLHDFGDADHLLCIGDPTVIAAATAIAASRNQGRFRLLVWDKLTGAYDSIPVDTLPHLFKRAEV